MRTTTRSLVENRQPREEFYRKYANYMWQSRNSSKPKVIVIGAGAGGFSAALELGNRGYQVELLEKNMLSSGASGNNPGRMGHGFHYTDIPTAIAYLRASVLVQRTYPGFLVGQDQAFESPIRHGRYCITKDSNPPKEVILMCYQAIKAEYIRLIEEDPRNEVFGPPETFYRILDAAEYQHTVNMTIIDTVIETSEHLFDWKKFTAYIKQVIANHPNITLLEHTEVIDISRNPIGSKRFTIKAQTDTQELLFFDTDYIVNSTWQQICFLNDKIGLRMIPGERTNRLKALIEIKLPESLINANSTFVCMGQYGMFSNLGNGRGMATYAKVTNMEVSSELAISQNAERLIKGNILEEEKAVIAEEMISGLANYIPELAKAELIDVKFGIVQTRGRLSISDLTNPHHPFNKREDHCVKAEQNGVVSNPCMKLFYFPNNGRLVADMIDQHVTATSVAKQCMKLICQQLEDQIKFDDKIKRVVMENLDRYELENLTEDNISKIVNSLVKKLTCFSKVSASLPYKGKP